MIDLPITDYMKDICAKEGRTFTDRECAAIAINNWTPLNELENVLRPISETTLDKELKERIDAYFEREAIILEQFKKNDNYPAVYGVRIDLDDDDVLYYPTFEAAYRHCCSDGKPMHVMEKYPLCGENMPQLRKWARVNPLIATPDDYERKEEYEGGAVAMNKVFSDGTFECMYSVELTPDMPEDPYWFFNNTVVIPPNPFERGDIVEFDGDVGVVETSQEDWHELIKRVEEGSAPIDYHDLSLSVEMVCDDGSFIHVHVNPLLLEPTPECMTEREKVALTFASALLRGQVSLCYFMDAYEQKWKVPLPGKLQMPQEQN